MSGRVPSGALLVLPYVLGSIVLVAVPALLTFVLAFTDFDALSPPSFVGLDSFRLALGDPLLLVAVRNSLFFIALAVPLRVGAALALALLLERRRRGVGGYRAAVYLPTVVPDAAYALIWLWVFNPVHGPVNLVLQALGLPLPAWLADPSTAKLVFVVMAVFQIGEGLVILLAGLAAVPPDLRDAAAVDGAGVWQRFRHVTFPLLVPWLLLLTCRDVILGFQYPFTPSLLMTGGDPYYATLFLPLFIYEEAFDRFRFGPGSAMMLLTFAVTALLLVAVYLAFPRSARDDEVA
jgi:multiple sugar transport system permease protein